MTYLLLGLIVFLGVHSIRIISEDGRERLRQRWGEGVYKGLFSLLALVGLVLVVWGFGQARETPVVVWMPAPGMRHLAAALTLLAFVFLAAAYVPGNWIKARLHHPMVLGVKAWALAHLLSNGMLAHLVLFGAFLVWAVLCFRASRQRDRRLGTTYPAGSWGATVVAVAVGVAAWAAVVFWLHGLLVGIRPLG